MEVPGHEAADHGEEEKADQVAAGGTGKFSYASREAGEDGKAAQAQEQIDDAAGCGFLPSTRLVSVSGTGLSGMGMDRGASMQVTAVISAVSTRLRVEKREPDETLSFVVDIDVNLLLLR